MGLRDDTERSTIMAPARPRDFVEARMTGDAFAPEFLLAAACCRWPPSEDRNTAIRTAAAGVADWNRFLWLVKRQRVIGLVHNALLSTGIELPSVVRGEIAQRAQRIVRRNLNMADETVRLQRTLEAANIPVLVLKGVALAQLAYGSVTIKQTRDIDLLVPPDRAEAALRTLEGQGYTLSSPAKHLSTTQRRALVRYAREVEVFHRGNEMLVELQWRVADNPLLLEGVDANSSIQTIALSNDVGVRTLAQQNLFAYLCVHGAHHSWSRLKWLADLNALISGGDADIGRLYRHAKQIGASLCAAQALLLCQRLFALRLPAGLAGEMQANSRAIKLTAIALAAMTAPHAGAEVDAGSIGVLRVVRTQFLLGQGWRFYLAQCRAASAGPADVIRLTLPPSLYFLYPLFRLPLWLWRRARAASNRLEDS
jgi:hypothetical protein